MRVSGHSIFKIGPSVAKLSRIMCCSYKINFLTEINKYFREYLLNFITSVIKNFNYTIVFFAQKFGGKQFTM